MYDLPSKSSRSSSSGSGASATGGAGSLALGVVSLSFLSVSTALAIDCAGLSTSPDFVSMIVAVVKKRPQARPAGIGSLPVDEQAGSVQTRLQEIVCRESVGSCVVQLYANVHLLKRRPVARGVKNSLGVFGEELCGAGPR
jgi:hypothetical protein